MKKYTILEAFEDLDNLEEGAGSEIFFVHNGKRYNIEEFKKALDRITDYVQFKSNGVISIGVKKSGANSIISMWDQNDRSAGDYTLPKDEAEFFNNLEWLLADEQHSVCCECHKQLPTAGVWHPFAGNYCKKCDALREPDDDEKTDWWN